MSRTRLIVSAIFVVVILGLVAAPTAWAGGLRAPSTPSVATAAAISPNAQGVILMDVDGDGKQDLVVVEPNSGVACGANFASQLEVFLGNGNGTFGAATAVPIPCEAGNLAPLAKALAHGQLLSGAAHPDDIVVATPGTNHIVVLANTSTAGTVSLAYVTNAPFALPTAGAVPQGLAIADVDGDGKQDIIVADAFNNQVDVLLGNAGTAATFTVTATSSNVGTSPVSVAVGNFGSAHTGTTSANDIAVANNGSGNVTVLVNTTTVVGTPTFSASGPYTVGTGPVAIAAALLGSGALDLAVANNGSSNVSVLLNKNDGSGTFNTAANTGVGGGPGGIVIADFNADTFNDIVVSDANGAEILFNSGTGALATPVSFIAGNTPAGIAIAPAPNDLNTPSDSYSDVAVADTGANTVSILLGTPFAALTPSAVPNQVEGASFGPVPLLTFTYDGNPAANTFTGTVNWNDTTAVDNLTGADFSGPAANVYTVNSLAHTFPDEGTFTPSITVTQGAQSITTNGSGITVNDAALAANPSTGDITSAGSAAPFTFPAATVVAQFTDANPNAATTDFTTLPGSINIDWGDTSTSAGTPVDGGCVTTALPPYTATACGAGAFHLFSVTGSHTYNTNGLFAVNTTVIDLGSSTTLVSIHANVGSLTLTAAANINTTEGTALSNQLLATLQSSAARTPASFAGNVSIDWGDCAGGIAGSGPGVCSGANLDTTTGSVTGGASCQSPATCNVTGSHTYKFGATGPGVVYNVVVTVKDTTDNSQGSASLTSTVADATLSAAVAQPAAITINEGAGVTGASVTVANFIDNNPLAVLGDFTGVTVHWNDANNTIVAGTVTGGPTNFSITASPAGTLYAEEGPPDVIVTFSVTDSGGGKGGQSLTLQNGVAIHVVDAPLSTTGTVNPIQNGANPLLAGVDLYNGPLGTFNDQAGASANLTDFDNPSGGGALNIAGSNVNWGDGNQENCTSNAATTPNCVISGPAPNFSVAGKHTFTKASSTLPVVITIIDKGGQQTVINDVANVTSLGNTTPQAVAAQTEGVKFTNVPLLNFTSHRTSPAPVAADFQIAATTINWADGTPVDNGAGSNLTVVAVGGGVFQIQGTHTYAEETNAPAGICSNAPCQTILAIKDNVDGSVLTNVTGPTVTVQDAPLAGTAVAALPSVNETINTQAPPELNNVTVVQFTDGNPNATVADFSAPNGSIVVDWGDGVTSAGTAVDSGNCVTTATGPFTNTACTTAGAFHLFSVTASHNYTEGGTDLTGSGCTAGGGPGLPANCTVKVTVNDEGGSKLLNFAGTTVQVGDAPLSALSVNNVSGGGTGPSGELVANVDNWNSGLTLTLATFSDANTGAPATDFTATINWGDTTSTNCPAATCVISSTGTPGQFKIVASHTFTEAGSQLTPISVTVTDKGGAAPVNASSTLAAVVTSMTNAVTQALNQVEGVKFTNQAVMNFTSHRTTPAPGDFSVSVTSITWGDGNTDTAPSANINVVSLGAGVFQIQGTHTYAEQTPAVCGANPCPLVVSIKDSVDGSTLLSIPGSTAAVADAPLNPATVAPLVPLAEGTALTNVPVLTFTDGNVGATTADFTTAPGSVSINWGDGNITTGSVQGVNVTDDGCVTTAGPPYTGAACAPGTFHLFTVTGTHTYAEGGMHPQGTCTPGSPNAICQITVTVLDEGGSNITNFNGTAAQVSDAPLVAGSLVVNPVTGATSTGTVSGQNNTLVANVDTWNGTVATFADTNTAAPTTDFNVLISWGDGNTTTCNAPCALVQTNGPGGQFKIVATHIFALAGSQITTPVTVTVSDIDSIPGVNQLGPTAGAKAAVTSLYQPATVSIAPTEGIGFSGAVGQFTGTVPGHPYAANITWGDGTMSAATGFTGGPVWTADGAHTYLEETLHEAACGNAPCPITLVVTDTVDGSTLNIPGPNPINGPIPGPTFPPGTATIADAALTATSGPGVPLGTFNESNVAQINGPVLTFSDGNPAAPVADFAATIYWGDGTNSVGTVTGGAGSYTVNGTHTYHVGGLELTGSDASGASCTPGTPAVCKIYVTVNDEGGSQILNYYAATINIADAPLTNPTGVGTLTPSTLGFSGNVGSFKDSDPGAPACPSASCDFTVSINWGDGTPVGAGTVTGPGGSGTYTVSGLHNYLTTGTLNSVTITVTDAGGATTTITGTSILTPATGGTDFLGTASPPNSSVVPGQSVDVMVTLTPQSFAGYNAQLQFTGCQIISGPAGPITCSFNPSSVPDVTVVRTVHMFVQTFSQQASLTPSSRPGHGNLMRLALLLPGFLGVFGVVLLGGSKRSRRRTILWFLASLLLLTFLIVGCGGGAPVITPGPQGTAPGTYVLRILTSDQPPATANPAPPNPGNGPDIQVTVHVQ